MRVLLTGASGFIGKNIIEKLSHKFEITPITTSIIDGCIQVKKNFEDINEVLKGKNFDVIVHLAAVVPASFSSATFQEVFMPNASMMDQLYQLSLRMKPSKFIYLSGFGSMVDYENYKMSDYYTLSKVHGEHVCAMMTSKGINAVSLRVSAPYGQYSTPNSVINKFVQNALHNQPLNVYGSGRREQNFIYIDDVVKAIELAILTQNKLEGNYSIVNSSNTSMLQLAKTIINLTNSSSEIIIGEYPDNQENFKPTYYIENAQKDIGFVSQYNIEDGLTEYLKIIRG